MAKPVLHGPGYSTYVRTARLALEEKGVEYDLNEINFIADGIPDDQLARHPFGKVPALSHDDFEVYEPVAIARYIDEAFDGPALQPSGAADRARMTQVCAILDSYTYPTAITGVFIQRAVMPMMVPPRSSFWISSTERSCGSVRRMRNVGSWPALQ